MLKFDRTINQDAQNRNNMHIYSSIFVRRIFWPTANHYNETLEGCMLKGCKHARRLNFGEKPRNFHVHLSSIRDVSSKQRSSFEFLYTDTDVEKERDIYIRFLFEEKGARKQCCRRTCGHSIHRIRSDL